jgi:hypothetical protein
MNLTERILGFMLLGSEWVLWLLIGLSVLSVAVMVERGIYLRAGGDAIANGAGTQPRRARHAG